MLLLSVTNLVSNTRVTFCVICDPDWLMRSVIPSFCQHANPALDQLPLQPQNMSLRELQLACPRDVLDDACFLLKPAIAQHVRVDGICVASAGTNVTASL